jgi:hypothetical protein
VSHRAHAVVLAAAIASGCQALDSAIPRQPAIPDIPFAGDRPDAPPLEQRVNGTFLFASYDPSGKYLVTVTLEDQLQVSVYDVSTGARLGRHVPAFENWEGSFKVSDDGSRIVIYKFVSDTFEVLDGNNAMRLGFVCPYFCNLKHNPAGRLALRRESGRPQRRDLAAARHGDLGHRHGHDYRRLARSAAKAAAVSVREVTQGLYATSAIATAPAAPAKTGTPCSALGDPGRKSRRSPIPPQAACSRCGCGRSRQRR